MDRYQTALRGEIAAHGERLAELRKEIAALTVRREALEHALTVYEETKPARTQRRPLGRAGSPTVFILNAIQESGPRGLSTSEIYERIANAGLKTQPTNIRSLLYQRKKAGMLEHLPNGRYRFPQRQANGADTEKAGDADLEQGTSPTLLDHRPDQPVAPPAQGR